MWPRSGHDFRHRRLKFLPKNTQRFTVKAQELAVPGGPPFGPGAAWGLLAGPGLQYLDLRRELGAGPPCHFLSPVLELMSQLGQEGQQSARFS